MPGHWGELNDLEIVPLHYALSLQAIGKLTWQTWCCKPGADFLLIDSERLTLEMRNLEMNKEMVYTILTTLYFKKMSYIAS